VGVGWTVSEYCVCVCVCVCVGVCVFACDKIFRTCVKRRTCVCVCACVCVCVYTCYKIISMVHEKYKII